MPSTKPRRNVRIIETLQRYFGGRTHQPVRVEHSALATPRLRECGRECTPGGRGAELPQVDGLRRRASRGWQAGDLGERWRRLQCPAVRRGDAGPPGDVHGPGETPGGVYAACGTGRHRGSRTLRPVRATGSDARQDGGAAGAHRAPGRARARLHVPRLVRSVERSAREGKQRSELSADNSPSGGMLRCQIRHPEAGAR